jgi:hypothetical protein
MVSDLRDRYSLAAEQPGSKKLPLAIAGVHSIESVTGEWFAQRNKVERQNCVSLLTELLRLAKKAYHAQSNISDHGSAGQVLVIHQLRLREEHVYGQ